MPDQVYVPSESLRQTLAKSLGICQAILPQLEYWEALAQTLPEIDPAVTELRIKWEYLARWCKCGLGQPVPQISVETDSTQPQFA